MIASVLRRATPTLVLFAALACALAAPAKTTVKEPEKPKDPFSKETLAGLEFRSIGPALISGRVVDIAVDPARTNRWFVAVASGGVWKTEDAGASWTPLFDGEGSYSIGCLALDPKNPAVVWVGTGENNSQRSVGYGDGVYRSEDGGASWKKMGLARSEHIGKILVDPRDSNVVWVAAQGPLWGPGGDRGLYRTQDGGKTWKAVLTISENTGVSDVVFDPRNPDVVYATAYQRRRHVWTLIDGGPESAIHKSTDGGLTWTKLTNGLPTVDLGRIGLAVTPANPDLVYATVEAADGNSGFYRSRDRGATWQKQSDTIAGGPQYYAEIVADPLNADRVYLFDVFNKISEDGGKTWRNLGERAKHVDNHALWIDPANTEHLVVGCDGGIYISWDRGAHWSFVQNLPVAQFYRVAVDTGKPFYTVYGGTQDNASVGGPSRTWNASGIVNADWFITHGGDGFVSAADPADPNIVYVESQYGVLARYDRRSGEEIGIQPKEGPGEDPARWNWDSPLIVSPHSHTRLYFAAQRVYRSDDRGDSWTPVSGDLTRKIDRNTLSVMGRVWGPDAVAKSVSTSLYGNVVQLAESPNQEGLLYAGTDDGLVQVSENGGGAWRRVESFPGVPERSYVAKLLASRHAAARVYAAFDNHKSADFKPYVLKSDDAGRTWTSIAGDLPADEFVWSLAEDRLDPQLLFAGTEKGLYVTRDGGAHWVRLNGKLPTIAVRDIAIPAAQDDLVLATFGRGFYVLDDYAPLRQLTPETLAKDAVLFPVPPALAYVPATPLGAPGKAWQGENFYTADNPRFGATFTYWLKDSLKTKKEKRQQAEKDALEKKLAPPPYPTRDELRAEAQEPKPELLFLVADADGQPVRRISAPADKGLHRLAWDLRFAPATPSEEHPHEADSLWDGSPTGPAAAPGFYTVTLASRVGGVVTSLAPPQTFEVVPAKRGTLAPADATVTSAFQRKAARLQRAAFGAVRVLGDAQRDLRLAERAALDAPGGDTALLAEIAALRTRMDALAITLNGDGALRARNEPTPLALIERAQSIVDELWTSTAAPTKTAEAQYRIASEGLVAALGELRAIDAAMTALGAKLEAAGAPWTPGRIPSFKPE